MNSKGPWTWLDIEPETMVQVPVQEESSPVSGIADPEMFLGKGVRARDHGGARGRYWVRTDTGVGHNKSSAIDWTFVSPEFLRWNLTCNVMVLGGGGLSRWLDHEGRDLRSEISDLIKETSMRTQWEGTRKCALTRYQIYRCLNFGLPRLRNCGK